MHSFTAFADELKKIAEDGFIPTSNDNTAPTTFVEEHDRKKSVLKGILTAGAIKGDKASLKR